MRKAKWWSIAITVVIVACSYWWWSKTLPVTTNTDSPRSGLLRVYSSYGEAVVKRFPSGLVELLEKGDRLESFDAIRTLENSHLVLHLTDSKDSLQLGEKTEISASGKVEAPHISIYHGEVFVSWHGEAGTQEREIDLGLFRVRATNADFLVRSIEGTPPFLEVYRGNLSVNAGDTTVKASRDEVIFLKNQRLSKKKFDFSITTPFQFDRIYYSKKQGFRTRFAWSGLPSNAKMQLLIGPKPDQLKSVSFSTGRKPNELMAVIPEGASYWKLAASAGERKYESPLMKIFGVIEQPAQLLEPIGRISKSAVKRLNGVYFRWTNPSLLEKLLLEVATDEKFKTVVLREPLADAEAQILSLNESGAYYWRVTGFRHDSSELVVSGAQKFEILDDLSEPELIYPEPMAQITARSLRAGEVFAVWRSSGLAQFEVELRGKGEVFKSLVSVNRYQLPALKKGQYKLIVAVVDSDSPPAEREFEVIDASPLMWKVRGELATLTTDQLQWDVGPSGTSVYKVRVWSLFPVQESRIPFREYLVSSRTWNFNLNEDGLYVAVVQALGADSRILAETRSLVFRPK